MAETKIEISTIVLKLGRKELKLTPEDAKKLQRVLNEMFDKTVIHQQPDSWFFYRNPYESVDIGTTATSSLVTFTTTASTLLVDCSV